MFVREKTAKQGGREYTYLQLVHNRRVDGKTRQKVLLSLGRKDKLDQDRIDEMVKALAEFTTAKLQVIKQAEELDLEAIATRRWGDLLVLDKLWKGVGLDRIIKRHLEERRFSSPLDVEAAIRAMVFNRCCDPRSKLGTYRWLKRKAYFPDGEGLKLHHFYRALDFLIGIKEELERDLYLQLVDLFNLDLSVVFYDTTLVSYEGEGPEELMKWSRRKSYDFLLGLALTRDGIPFSHEVMPGNTTDSTTLKAWVEKLKGRFKIGRCIICADRGIVTWENLKFLEEEIPYLVGMPLRKFKEVNEGVLSTRGRYREVADNLMVKETKVGGIRYLICFNPKEARRKAAEREELIQKLEEEIQSLRPAKEGHTKRICELLSHRIKGKYLRELESGELVIDRKAVKEEARYDGKFVLRTSEEELSGEELALAYKELIRIEHSFRSIKSFVEIAPVYHWAERRVRAHVVVCVLAHLLERLLERELRRAGSELSVFEALEALEEVQAVDVVLQGRGYRLGTRPPAEAGEVFRILGMRAPRRIQEL